MEGQPKGLVDIFTTLPVVEKVRLEVLDDREQGAAGRVSRDAAVGAGYPADKGTYRKWKEMKVEVRIATTAKELGMGTHRWRAGELRERRRRTRGA